MIQYIIPIAFSVFLIGVGNPARRIAATIDVDDVRAAVEAWLRFENGRCPAGCTGRHHAALAGEGGRRRPTSPICRAAVFCICGADSRVLPVYFYSPHGTFDADREDFTYILWEIDARRAYLEAEAGRLRASSALF